MLAKPNFIQRVQREFLLILAIVITIPLCNGTASSLVWGDATNGVRLGINISPSDLSLGHPPLCIVYVQNVSTNRVDLRVPSANSRFLVRLRGPNRYLLDLKPGRSISDFSGAKRRILKPSEISQVDYFSVPDAFMIQTNGTHELTILLRISTNGFYAKTPEYFSLPPITQSFDVPLIKPKK